MERTNLAYTVEELAGRLSAMAAQLDSLSSENARLAADNARYALEIERLLEQIKLMNTRAWSPKTERSEGQLALFNEVEAAADDDVPEPGPDDVVAKPRKRGGKRRLNLDELETVVIEHRIPAGERLCPSCGSELAGMGVEVTKTVRLVPAHLVVEEHRREVCRCERCCSQNAEDGSVPSVIVRAEMPSSPIPGSIATPSLISHIMFARYINATTLYRLEDEFACLGAAISRQNMANWVMSSYERWLSLICGRMRDHLLGNDIIHADETEVKVVKEPGREASDKSYMWLLRSAAADIPICVYHYAPSRGGEVVSRLLGGWAGTLCTDGYQAYYSLPGVTNVSCLVHVRRKFAEIVKSAGGDAEAARSQSVALAARRKLDEIFHLDSKLDGMDPQTRKRERDRLIKPKLESFGKWAQSQRDRAVEGFALHSALNYACAHMPYVKNVLADGRLEFSNNIAERAIKTFVIGRKNSLFSFTPRGAEASAGCYSVMVTAKLNGLRPRDYVEWVLTEMPNAGELTDEVVDRFLPWSEHVPPSCKVDRSGATAAE